MHPAEPVVAVLHQATPPVDHDGIVKPAKPGGYRDSGADIAFALRRAGVAVTTPDPEPNPALDTGWTFPDTDAGIAAAIASGATALWANTVLFGGHPLERYMGRVRIVGQLPAAVGRYDDKAVTNRELRDTGIPVVRHVLLSDTPREDAALTIDTMDVDALARQRLAFPLVIKPIRGRGSAGVAVVDDLSELRATATAMVAVGQFGTMLMLEPYLPGAEVTVTVMPPDRSGTGNSARHWCLPPVRRFNHHRGVAPYNGTVAVVRNSAVLSRSEQNGEAMVALLDACRRAAEHIEARAPIRIDCRQDTDGAWRLFDLNLKPNMTGPGRPGRDDQLSLTGIAAAAAGMSYPDLVTAMLRGAW